MPYRVAASTLNASTLDILNVIRANASYDYQSSVPEVTTVTDIPKVGEIIYGTPAFANQFINALVNRIALVKAKSAMFNNPYADLKKGYLNYGESIEEIFVNIAKVIEYTPEKGEEREFQRNLPDVKSAFHTMNWRVIYPVTIQDEDLRLAFLSAEGVTELIQKVVDSVYRAAEYDEFLLFKYLIIKYASTGKMYPIGIDTSTDTSAAAIAFRGISNKLQFMSSSYNMAGVKTATPKENQVIFMDAEFNAQFDVEVLASAFNMEKADFMGKLYLIDSFSTFDNDRFEIIRENSDGLEEVTDEELSLLDDVRAVILDKDWFQVYDNNNKFTEKYVASGLYWNYFYHVWKTVSVSPFANSVLFVENAEDDDFTAESLTYTVASVDTADEATVITLLPVDSTSFDYSSATFVQTEEATAALIAITANGAIFFPASAVTAGTAITLQIKVGDNTYTASATISAATEVGTTLNFT